MTAGVALTRAELAQPARIERRALAEPVVSIAKCVDVEGDIISPEVKSGPAATCPDGKQNAQGEK